jgi:Skp family chaperone for outer membrane proteins
MQQHMRLLATCLMCAVTAGLTSAASQKIAVVDMEKVMTHFGEFKEAEVLLKKQLEEFELEQDELLDERDKLKEEFEAAREEASNKALSDSAREKQFEKARDRAIALKEHERRIRKTTAERQKELSERGVRMRKRIVTKLSSIIQAYAEKNEVTLVIDSSSLGMTGIEAVIYSKPELDITPDILKITSDTKPE